VGGARGQQVFLQGGLLLRQGPAKSLCGVEFREQVAVPALQLVDAGQGVLLSQGLNFCAERALETAMQGSVLSAEVPNPRHERVPGPVEGCRS
jgi:hypothetical protein